MLLAETLRSSTLKLALISIAIFGVAVLALFGYVYWSTSTYVLGRADGAIAAEQAALRKVYDSAGRGALVATIAQRVADKSRDGAIYLLTDPSFAPVAGNLEAWPAGLAPTPRAHHTSRVVELIPLFIDRQLCRHRVGRVAVRLTSAPKSSPS